MGDKQNIDYIEFETSGKNSKVKCKFISVLNVYIYMCVCLRACVRAVVVCVCLFITTA